MQWIQLIIIVDFFFLVFVVDVNRAIIPRDNTGGSDYINAVFCHVRELWRHLVLFAEYWYETKGFWYCYRLLLQAFQTQCTKHWGVSELVCTRIKFCRIKTGRKTNKTKMLYAKAQFSLSQVNKKIVTRKLKLYSYCPLMKSVSMDLLSTAAVQYS